MAFLLGTQYVILSKNHSTETFEVFKKNNLLAPNAVNGGRD